MRYIRARWEKWRELGYWNAIKKDAEKNQMLPDDENKKVQLDSIN